MLFVVLYIIVLNFYQTASTMKRSNHETNIINCNIMLVLWCEFVCIGDR